MGAVRASFLIAAVAAALTAAPAAQRRSVRDLLESAGTYSQRYHEAFTAVVAEEHYVQRVIGADLPQRTLKADVMLIRGVRGENAWFFFRDVFEVDGKPVSSDRGRLESWLRESLQSFMHKARALALEQARFNIGDILRTINVPLMALEFLLPVHQPRFRFRAGAATTASEAGVTTVSYEERRHPTMIRTPDGDDIEARGTFWIETGTGRVLRTELRTGERNERQVRATITVTYEPNERLGMLVPASMDEAYSAGSVQIAGAARYSNFRRFETDARIVR